LARVYGDAILTVSFLFFLSMQYLEAFKEYLETGRSSKNVPFSPEVKQQLLQTYQETAGKGWPLQFEILPGVQENIKDKKGTKVFEYKGKFVYGFYKNGLYYEFPGDDSPSHTEKPIDGGEVLFLTDASGQVVAISESFAGNTFGSEKFGGGNLGGNVKRKPRIGITLLIVFLLYILFQLFEK